MSSHDPVEGIALLAFGPPVFSRHEAVLPKRRSALVGLGLPEEAKQRLKLLIVELR
jgi:hypothetical protein